MTVEDLIDALEEFPKDAKVLFACDYGDISHTEQALPVESAGPIEELREMLAESAYSHSGMAIEKREYDLDDEDDEDNDDEYEVPNVVILR